jgi:hypothetical protein
VNISTVDGVDDESRTASTRATGLLRPPSLSVGRQTHCSKDLRQNLFFVDRIRALTAVLKVLVDGLTFRPNIDHRGLKHPLLRFPIRFISLFLEDLVKGVVVGGADVELGDLHDRFLSVFDIDNLSDSTVSVNKKKVFDIERRIG